MFCQHCGTPNSDNSRFCARCGGLLNPNPVPRPAPQPVYYAAPPVHTVQAPANPRVLDAVKRIGRSPVMLMICICYTLMLMISLLNTSSNSSLLSLLQTLKGMDLPVGDIYYAFLRMDTASKLIISLISLTPTILITIGLWMIYGASFTKQNRMSTAGLTMIKVVQIISLVMVCIAFGIMLIAMIFAIISAYIYRASAAAMGLSLLFATLLLGGVMAFVIVYYAKIIGSINKAKTTIQTGVPNRKISGFVAVMCFISAGVNLISILGTLVSLARTGLGMFTLITILNTLLSTTFMVLVGVLMFMYKSKMKQLENPVPLRPVYQAPVAPVQPVAPIRPVTPAPVRPAPAAPAPAPAPEVPAEPEVVAEPDVVAQPEAVAEPDASVVPEVIEVAAEPVAPAENAAPLFPSASSNPND